LILLNGFSHGAPAGNRIGGALPVLRTLIREAVEVPPSPPANGVVREGVRNLDSIRAHALTVAGILGGTRPPIYNLGPDCGGELAVIASLNRWMEGRLHVVWFDAHADLNTPASSPSGNFHGMVLRTLAGEGPPCLADLVPLPLSPRQITLAGLRDADPPELEYLARHGIPVMRRFEPPDIPGPLYIHVDYDVLDGAVYRDSVYPTPDGMTLDELTGALQWLRSHREVVGMSLTEYVPNSGDTGVVRRLLSEGFGL
jgi:arginase